MRLRGERGLCLCKFAVSFNHKTNKCFSIGTLKNNFCVINFQSYYIKHIKLVHKTHMINPFLSIHKQKALRRDCIYNIEIIREIGVSGVNLQKINIVFGTHKWSNPTG